MRHWIAAAALLLGSAPTFACVNGWDSSNEENQFRSSYGSKPAAKPVENSDYRPSNRVLIGIGGMGLVTLGTLALMTLRPRT